ncbi:solute carrier family 22 member 8-like [Amphibalanus amphitrite]|uniref:solute carrier family 22 member 8-like n=1 Tax=Amphibalanus amphitrite TaxID=1232801 RepID=UPI001C921686|nr:solute carrier family 22 member 8-like [Amphibalanus amphitrite]
MSRCAAAGDVGGVLGGGYRLGGSAWGLVCGRLYLAQLLTICWGLVCGRRYLAQLLTICACVRSVFQWGLVCGRRYLAQLLTICACVRSVFQWGLVCGRRYLAQLLTICPCVRSVFQWGLVCGRRYLAQLLTTLYLAGALFGGPVLGLLSDRFGRQPVMLLCLYTQLVIGVGLFFVRRLVVFIGLRTLQGFFIQGLEGSSWLMLAELVPADQRPAAAAGAQFCWALGGLLLTLCQHCVGHWRYVQLAISIPSLVTLLYIWLIPESVAWLVEQRLRRRARHVVCRLVRCNGQPVSTELLAHLDQVAERLCAAEHGPATDRRIRRRAPALLAVWLCLAVSSAGARARPLPLGPAGRLARSAAEGAAHAAGALLALLLTGRLRRRTCLAAALTSSAALLAATATAHTLLDGAAVDVPALVASLLLLGRAVDVCSRCCLLLSTVELAPASRRGLLLGGALLAAGSGPLLAPRLPPLMASHPAWSQPLVLAGVSVAGALLALLLPDGSRQPATSPPLHSQAGRHHSESSGADTAERYQTGDGRRRRPGAAASSLCSCSCRSSDAGVASVLLTADNVTLRPVYGGAGSASCSCGQLCPQCAHSLRRPGGPLGGARSPAAAARYAAPPCRAGPSLGGGVERRVVDGRIVTVRRRADEPAVSRPGAAQAQTVGSHGLFGWSTQRRQLENYDHREARPGAAAHRDGDGGAQGPPQGLMRLVISRVGA